MNLIYLLNFLSRWVLFAVTGYKAYRERSIGWSYMALAFFLSAVDPERFLLEPLGFHLNNDVSYVLDMINTTSQGVLALLAAIYIQEPEPKLGVRITPSALGILAYLWITVTNALELHLSFVLKTIFPVVLYAFSFGYLGYIVLRYSFPGNVASRLFVGGMWALAVLNFTYPYTINLSWFREYGFFFATVFRLVMAVGAVGAVVWSVRSVKVTRTPESGAFIISDKRGERLLKELRGSPNSILITRGDIRRIKDYLMPTHMVFWVTRATEGEIEKNPPIYAVSPTKLGILLDLLTKAIESGYYNIFIDAVEYLVIENGFKTTFKFLLDLKDRVLAKNGRIVIAIDPETLDKGQINMLKREFEELS